MDDKIHFLFDMYDVSHDQVDSRGIHTYIHNLIIFRRPSAKQSCRRYSITFRKKPSCSTITDNT